MVWPVFARSVCSATDLFAIPTVTGGRLACWTVLRRSGVGRIVFFSFLFGFFTCDEAHFFHDERRSEGLYPLSSDARRECYESARDRQHESFLPSGMGTLFRRFRRVNVFAKDLWVWWFSPTDRASYSRKDICPLVIGGNEHQRKEGNLLYWENVLGERFAVTQRWERYGKPLTTNVGKHFTVHVFSTKVGCFCAMKVKVLNEVYQIPTEFN